MPAKFSKDESFLNLNVTQQRKLSLQRQPADNLRWSCRTWAVEVCSCAFRWEGCILRVNHGRVPACVCLCHLLILETNLRTATEFWLNLFNNFSHRTYLPAFIDLEERHDVILHKLHCSDSSSLLPEDLSRWQCQVFYFPSSSSSPAPSVSDCRHDAPELLQ